MKSYPDLVVTARNKLKLLRVTDSQIRKIETKSQIQEKIDVYATKSGYITHKNVLPGDYVNVGDLFFQISDFKNSMGGVLYL